MHPKVSIIIPVYNSQQYLKKSLESVLQQTYSNKEIIIVDDGSTDNSYTIAKRFESENCKVLKQTNAGAAVARNTGLANATGDYIQFLDVDDYLSVDKIEKQVLALRSHRNKVAVCNYISFIDDNELMETAVPKDQSGFIYSTDDPAKFIINLLGGYGAPNFIQTNSWLVPRQVIDSAGGWRNYRCPDDDGEFFTRVLLASNGIVYVPGVVNYYRKPLKMSTLSNNNKKKYLQNTLLSIDLKRNYLHKYIGVEGYEKAFATQYFEFAVYNYPRNIVLSKIAERRYKTLGVRVPTPILGGKIVAICSKILGWKCARWLRYYLNEKRLFDKSLAQ